MLLRVYCTVVNSATHIMYHLLGQRCTCYVTKTIPSQLYELQNFPMVYLFTAIYLTAVDCIAGYRRSGSTCTICVVNTYNAADDASTTCPACTSPKTTATNNGQSDCLGV